MSTAKELNQEVVIFDQVIKDYKELNEKCDIVINKIKKRKKRKVEKNADN